MDSGETIMYKVIDVMSGETLIANLTFEAAYQVVASTQYPYAMKEIEEM